MGAFDEESRLTDTNMKTLICILSAKRTRMAAESTRPSNPFGLRRLSRAVRICLGLLALLLACSCTHVSQSRIRELQPAMAAASYVPSGPDDFSFIDPIARGKGMLFIGEIPHHVPAIYPAVLRLSLHLRKELGYSVVAMENVYSDWPYYEAQSLGHNAPLPNVIPESERMGDPRPWFGPVVAYNRGAPADQRLLATTLDLDHAIYHTKAQTVLYLGYLASLSSSS